jgi:hypothetical protein
LFRKADEISSLQKTEELFKSNLFRLQIDELLKVPSAQFSRAHPRQTVTVDYGKTSAVESLLHAFKSALDTLPERQVEEKAGAEVLGITIGRSRKAKVLARLVPRLTPCSRR